MNDSDKIAWLEKKLELLDQQINSLKLENSTMQARIACLEMKSVPLQSLYPTYPVYPNPFNPWIQPTYKINTLVNPLNPSPIEITCLKAENNMNSSPSKPVCDGDHGMINFCSICKG